MVFIAIVYALLYFKLKEQAEIRQKTSSHDAHAQLNKISRTFKRVLMAFYVCYLPFTLQYLVHASFQYFGIKVNAYASNIALTITSNLWVINCCINPLIYSKIHTRIYEHIRPLMITIRDSCFCSNDLCRSTSKVLQRNSTSEPSRIIHKANRPNQQQQHQECPELEMDDMCLLKDCTA